MAFERFFWVLFKFGVGFLKLLKKENTIVHFPGVCCVKIEFTVNIYAENAYLNFVCFSFLGKVKLLFVKRLENCPKSFVLGPGAQKKIFWFLSRTPLGYLLISCSVQVYISRKKWLKVFVFNLSCSKKI